MKAAFAYVVLGEFALVTNWWPHWSPLRSVAVMVCIVGQAVVMWRGKQRTVLA